MTTDILLIFALEHESRDQFDGFKTLYTGVGKVNAAFELAKYLSKNKPDLVINLGTAGSNIHKAGDIVNPTSFIQRDMDVTPLGFAPYETPFSTKPATITYGEYINDLSSCTCGTGDNFAVAEDFGHGAYQIVDMEAYAIASACQDFDVPFACIKYISDGADGQAHQEWEKALEDGARKMRVALDEYLDSL